MSLFCMDDRTGPNNCTGPNWYGGPRFWSDIIWYGPWSEVNWSGPWSVILVRNFGPKLIGPVRGPKIWSETQWSGPGPNFWSVISVPVRDGPVRSVFFKDLIFPDRTDYGPTYLVRNRSGPLFLKIFLI